MVDVRVGLGRDLRCLQAFWRAFVRIGRIVCLLGVGFCEDSIIAFSEHE